MNFIRQLVWIFVDAWGLACSAILLVTSSPFITNVVWSHNSQALLIAALLLGDPHNPRKIELQIIYLRNGQIGQLRQIDTDYSLVNWIQTD